jgi:hypothetical protein
MNGDEAAAQAYSGDVEQALSLLRLFYGDEYTFGYDAALGVFWVIRDGLIGSMLTAPAPEALGALVDGNPGLTS